MTPAQSLKERLAKKAFYEDTEGATYLSERSYTHGFLAGYDAALERVRLTDRDQLNIERILKCPTLNEAGLISIIRRLTAEQE